MKAFSVMIKSLKEQVRDVRGLALATALPGAFMIIFGLAFGGGWAATKIVYEDLDGGAGAQVLKAAFEADRYDLNKNGKPDESEPRSVDLIPGDTKAAIAEREKTIAELEGKSPSAGKVEREKWEKAVERATKTCGALAKECAILGAKVSAGEGSGFIIVPPGFSERVATGTVAESTALITGGDPGKYEFLNVVWYSNHFAGEVVKQVTGNKPISALRVRWLGEETTKSEFDWSAPGIMVFAIMLLVAQTAMIVVAEVQRGTLQRLRLTAMRASDLFLGITGSQMVFAVFQVVLMFAVAVALGYSYEGTLFLPTLLCIGLSLCAVGCGLIVSCIAKTPMEAANFGAGVLMPMVFLSGSMFPIPPIPIFEWGDRVISVWHALPPTHVVEALRKSLTYGAPMSDCLFELVMTFVLSLGYLLFGVLVFQRVRMKTEY